jgi:uncharacterized membrane protein YhaH (DUF805 family)
MQWYLKALKNYVVFSGRATRMEYWMFYLINSIVILALAMLIGISESLVFISVLYSFGIVLPSWAVAVRRLHDTGRSGWWVLISMIPLVGGIILLVFLCQKSDGNNYYGSSFST